MGQKLVVIDTKTLKHSAFEGRTKVGEAAFTRVMFQDEVEAFRLDPKPFIDAVQEVEDESVSGDVA